MAPSQYPPDFAPDVARIFEQRIETGKTPGAYFAIFDAHGILFEGGVGRKNDTGAPPDADTRFRIASCTKSFTAAMLLILRDSGALHLDDPIMRYVPEFAPTRPRSHPVAPTVRMLMTMSGGLPSDDPWADRQEAMSSEELREVISQGVHFCSVPGTAYEYSNLGYALLGQVIEHLTGLSYCEAVTKYLLRPLGLEATTFDFATVPRENLAIGYRQGIEDWIRLPFSGPGAFSSIGGAITTAEDLATWCRWFCAAFNEDCVEDGVLSAASRREMQQIHRPIPLQSHEQQFCPYGYGFGLRVHDDPQSGRIVHHSGGYPGFSSHMRWSLREGIGVVAFENATYCATAVPATAALQRALETQPARCHPDVPPDIIALAQGLKSVLASWKPDLADEICLANVALDRPYAERAAETDMVVQKTGRPDFASATIRNVKGYDDYSRFELLVPCTHGTLQCQVHIGPTLPRKIQGILLKAVLSKHTIGGVAKLVEIG